MKSLTLTLSVLTALAAGAAGGYLFAREKLGREFDERLENELAAMEKHYRKVAKRGEFSTAEGALAAIRPELVDATAALSKEAGVALTKYQGHFDESKVDVPIATSKNIFSKDHPDVDKELLKRDRTEEAPYVLEEQEYMDGELEYTQITLTYFQGDDVIVDERDEVVEGDEVDRLVGLDNLKRFGIWYDDPNVVYVRNHEKELDIEVNRHEGNYSEVVLGLPKET
jgi:hypothetical protein